MTAMTTIRRSTSGDENGISYLIVATESGDIYFLNAHSFAILHQARVCAFEAAAPSLLSASGSFDVDYRIVISTRCGYLDCGDRTEKKLLIVSTNI